MRFPAALVLCLIFSAASAVAGPPALSEEDAFFNLERASLEETLNIKTSVATRSAMSLRETPGLVTVITREEIQASGARDLLDVLRAVPEFEFGVDVQGNLGLGVRGVWGNEGKVLLLWDGQTYNEILYSTLQFDRFPVDQVEEVEIIRGPGSAIYGGFAELAVINIKTRSARSLSGSAAYAAWGQGAGARSYAGYSFGKTAGETSFSGKAHWGEAQRGAGRYTDFSGSSFGMNGRSDQRPRSLNLKASANNTSARLILDAYSMRQRDHYTSALSSGSTEVSFQTLFAELKQAVYLPGLWRLEGKANYMTSRPWLEKDEHFPYDKRADRLTLALTAFYRHSAEAEFLAGGEYFHDAVEVGNFTGAAAAYPDGRDSADYDNHAFFGQGTADLGPAKVTAGARYDRNSQYGASLVPRLALTRLAGDFNFKALYSQAFRAPSVENIRLNPGINPEKSTSREFEAGYKVSDTVFASANIFYTEIEHPVVYTVVNGAETYRNYEHTGTHGGGFTLKYKSGARRADLGYLFQETTCNKVDLYGVAGRGSYLLAFPRHKVTLTASLPLREGLSLNPAAVYVSKRYGYGGDGSLKVFGERVTTDLNMQLKDRPVGRLTLSLGVKDLFNSGYNYLQPYDGGHAPLPGPSRELFLKAAYEF